MGLITVSNFKKTQRKMHLSVDIILVNEGVEEIHLNKENHVSRDDV